MTTTTGHLTDTEREALAGIIAAEVWRIHGPDSTDEESAAMDGENIADVMLASDWLAAREAAAVEAALAPVRALTEDLWRVSPCGCGHRADLHGWDRGCIGGLTLCECNRTFSSIVTERLRAVLPPAPTEGES